MFKFHEYLPDNGKNPGEHVFREYKVYIGKSKPSNILWFLTIRFLEKYYRYPQIKNPKYLRVIFYKSIITAEDSNKRNGQNQRDGRTKLCLAFCF